MTPAIVEFIKYAILYTLVALGFTELYFMWP